MFGVGLGPVELLIVGALAVLLFGSRLPEVARSAGKSLTEFRRGMQGLQDDVRRSMDVDSYTPPSRQIDHDAADADDEPVDGGYPEPTPTPFEPEGVQARQPADS